jgi:hypothetical protein
LHQNEWDNLRKTDPHHPNSNGNAKETMTTTTTYENESPVNDDGQQVDEESRKRMLESDKEDDDDDDEWRVQQKELRKEYGIDRHPGGDDNLEEGESTTLTDGVAPTVKKRKRNSDIPLADREAIWIVLRSRYDPKQGRVPHGVLRRVAEQFHRSTASVSRVWYNGLEYTI